MHITLMTPPLTVAIVYLLILTSVLFIREHVKIFNHEYITFEYPEDRPNVEVICHHPDKKDYTWFINDEMIPCLVTQKIEAKSRKLNAKWTIEEARDIEILHLLIDGNDKSIIPLTRRITPKNLEEKECQKK